MILILKAYFDFLIITICFGVLVILPMKLYSYYLKK